MNRAQRRERKKIARARTKEAHEAHAKNLHGDDRANNGKTFYGVGADVSDGFFDVAVKFKPDCVIRKRESNGIDTWGFEDVIAAKIFYLIVKATGKQLAPYIIEFTITDGTKVNAKNVYKWRDELYNVSNDPLNREESLKVMAQWVKAHKDAGLDDEPSENEELQEDPREMANNPTKSNLGRRYVYPREASNRTGLSQNEIRRLCDLGVVASYRPGKTATRTMVNLKSLQDYIAQNGGN